MKHSQRGRRGVMIALAVVLLSLTALSVAGATLTREAAKTADGSVALAEAYHAADSAVAAEESLERLYRLEPDPQTRRQHAQAADKLELALADVVSLGTPDDDRLATLLRADHAAYLSSVIRMFDAVDAGDPATVESIDATQTDPAFSRISDVITTASARHAETADDALNHLQQIEDSVFVTTIAGFGAGLALVAVFLIVANNYQKALLRQTADNRHRETHDPLTGLPNRTLLIERLQETIDRAPEDISTAVIVLDLDRFRDVNDTLGNECGDELLRQTAQRTRSVVRSSDLVSRISGDEFALLVPDTSVPESMTLAHRLIAEVNRSFVIEGVDVDVEASIGIALAPQHGTTADALLRNAEVAMHNAKKIKTGAVLYQNVLKTDGAEHLRLLGDLRRALDTDDQLSLHYQPKIDLHTGHPCGVEALIRWKHPNRGMISPADFIPVAENTGLINPFTVRVLEMAIRQAHEWMAAGSPLPVAVNLSPRCLLDPDLIHQITSTLRSIGLPPSLLHLEVTETAVMADPAVALTALHQLKDLGIQLSIDDFGTGYSSMAYLKQLPVSELKIDRTFVSTMDTDPDDAILVRATIDLGHNLGLTVTAEGVETEAQATALSALGCDTAQGYH
ncbi:MAG TPA: bifunctional diguanylate cyclase/phosphodiesterase, partial [Actinoplanes sp.]|nr:bifunctional diguanylate cyclase/phosphodiesterase [Actinoplanes sp.]